MTNQRIDFALVTMDLLYMERPRWWWGKTRREAHVLTAGILRNRRYTLAVAIGAGFGL